MLSAEKIVIQIADKKGANLGVDSGIASVFSNKLNYSKELEGMVAAENVFIGYISILPNEQDIKRKASKSVHHKSSGSKYLQLAVYAPENKTGKGKYDWLGSSMNDKIEMSFQRIPKFYVVTSRKEDARYHVKGSYKKIGSRFEIDLTLIDSFRNNEQILKYNNAIKVDNIDELYEYQISVINAFIKPLGVDVKEEEKEVIKTVIETTKNIDLVKLYNEASLLYMKGEYNQAYDLLEKILSKDPNFIDAINRMGHVLNSLAKYKMALEHYKKVFNIAIEKNDQVWITACYNNIGKVLEYQGKYNDALDYYAKSLEISEKIYGEDHPDTATTYNNIGGVYYSLGKYKDALVYYEKTLKIYEDVYGQGHPDFARIYNNIGQIYDAQGKYEEALVYLKKAIEIEENTLGTEHPVTAASYNNIGAVYDNLEKNEEALSYYDKALKICKKVYGTEHPHTAAAYNNIGAVYKKQEKFEEALSYYKKALKICEKVYGTEHPHTAISHGNIGGVYRGQGKYKLALEKYIVALEILKNNFGYDHPIVKSLCETMSKVYKKLGDEKNAKKYAELAQ